MTKELSGKTALVTGGSRGLGRGMSERLAAAGAIVAVNYANNEQAAKDTVAAIEAKGGQAFMIQAHLGKPGAAEKLLAEMDKEFQKRAGRTNVDILVNNIGGGGYGTIATATPEFYDETFSNNVRAPFFLTQLLLPRLTDKGGRVINISSAGSRLTSPDIIVYSMAKAALDKFTEVMAKELGPRGITVNGVMPGFNETDVNMDLDNDEATRKQIESVTLLGRFGRAEDIAEVVYFLATPGASWVTGQTIEASGGFSYFNC
jgi:NAD(P)-dependent dehydrogenase (short-subunit alcohol dehydrogenase family)